MKKFMVFEKLSVQLIAAMALSFFVSIGAFLELLSKFEIYFMNNKGINNCILSYIALSTVFIVPIVIFIIIFLLLVRKKVNYIKYISEGLNKITKDEFGKPLNVLGYDEIAELCENINYMSMEIEKSFEHERKLENEKREMITNISNDLRVPTTAIIEYLNIIKNKKCKNQEEEKELLSEAYNMSMKLNKLISELFEYTKLSSINMKLKLVEVDLGFMLIKILEDYKPRLEEKGLQLKVDINEEIIVKIDYEKITEAVNNILNYVEKYSEQQSDLTIKAETKYGAAHIYIANKSEYLENDKLNTMFENFNGIDISKSIDADIAELSLGISKKIIELHHGQILTEWQGTTRTIHIEMPIRHKNN